MLNNIAGKKYVILVFTLTSSFGRNDEMDGLAPEQNFNRGRPLPAAHPRTTRPCWQLSATHQAMQHLVDDCPQAPPVHGPIIRLLTKHFGSQVLSGETHSFARLTVFCLCRQGTWRRRCPSSSHSPSTCSVQGPLSRPGDTGRSDQTGLLCTVAHVYTYTSTGPRDKGGLKGGC